MSTSVSHVVQAIFAAGAVLAADSIDPFSGWAALIEKFGLAVMLVAFFIWTGWEREKRMGKRIDYLEKQSNTQSGKVGQLTELVAAALERDNEAMQRIADVLGSRPCFCFSTREEFMRWQHESAKRQQN